MHLNPLSHPSARATDEKTASNDNGFTLIELMTVLAVAGIVSAVAIYSMREGARTRYAVSQESRNLVLGLQTARMRALEHTAASAINADLSVNTATYECTVTFTGSNTGFDKGNYVTFYNVNKPQGINGGIYYVSDIPSDKQLKFNYYGSVDSPSPPYTPPAYVRNMTKAAELIVKKRSALTNPNDPGSAEYKDKRYFVYDDKYTLFWITGAWKPEDGVVDGAVASKPPAEFTVAFDSRGFASNPSGYELRYAPRNVKKDDPIPWIRVSPFGTIKPGH